MLTSLSPEEPSEPKPGTPQKETGVPLADSLERDQNGQLTWWMNAG